MDYSKIKNDERVNFLKAAESYVSENSKNLIGVYIKAYQMTENDPNVSQTVLFSEFLPSFDFSLCKALYSFYKKNTDLFEPETNNDLLTISDIRPAAIDKVVANEAYTFANIKGLQTKLRVFGNAILKGKTVNVWEPVTFQDQMRPLIACSTSFIKDYLKDSKPFIEILLNLLDTPVKYLKANSEKLNAKNINLVIDKVSTMGNAVEKIRESIIAQQVSENWKVYLDWLSKNKLKDSGDNLKLWQSASHLKAKRPEVKPKAQAKAKANSKAKTQINANA